MSSQAKLILRPPPHVNFIQGYPGIPSSASNQSSIRSRPSAHIAGSVEVRLGSKGLKASWLRIELRKLESVNGENWGELIGRGPIDVWTAATSISSDVAISNSAKEKKHSVYKGRDEEDEDGWETLQTADFPFHISIPEGLPPTARIDKQSSISYEVVTSLCVLTKKGLLRKESAQSIIQSTHPITLEKHELHSTWPIYHIPEEHTSTSDDVSAKVFRSQTCYSPGDSVSIRAVILSNRVSPIKLKNVSFSIRETVTFKGLSNSAAKRMSSIVANSSTEGKEKAASQRTETIAQKSKSVGKKLYKGDNQMLDLQVQIPKTHSLMTIRTAKHIEVAYTLRVHVDLAKNPIIIDHLPVTICNFSQAASKDLTSRIGYVSGLSDSGTQSAPSIRADSLRYESSVEDPRSRFSNRRSRSYAGSTSSGPNRPQSDRLASGPSTPRGRDHTLENQFPFGNGSGSDSPRRFPQRNDTAYTAASTSSGTTVSGPGVAGRGATGAGGGNTGNIFSWGQYGAAQPYSSDPDSIPTPPPVRSAFAGPASIYNGNDGTGLSSLTNEENRALAHHSVRPQSLAMLGGYDPITGNDYTDTRASLVPGQIVGAPPSRLNDFEVIEEGVQGFRSSTNVSSGQIGGPQHQFRERTYSTPSSNNFQSSTRPSSSPNFITTNSLKPNFDPSNPNSSNTNLSSNSPSTPNSTNFSTTPTTPNGPFSSAAAAEAEKMRLYERARQQAERNQRRADERRAKAANANGTILSNRSVSTPETGGAVRTSTISSTFSSNHENAEAEKMRLYERARKQAEKYQAGYKQGASFPEDEANVEDLSNSVSRASLREAHSNSNRFSGSVNPHLGNGVEDQRPNFDKRGSANFWMTPQGGSVAGGSNTTSQTVSAATSTSSLVAPTSINNQFGSGSNSSGTPLPPGAFPSAEEEKRRLYESAKAQTEAHLRQESIGANAAGSSSSFDAGGGLSPSASGSISAATGSSTSSNPRSMSQAISAVDEKAQMKRFYEAQDAVARHQWGEPSSAMQPGGGPSQTPYETAPVPTYELATSSRLSVLDGTSSRPQTSDSSSRIPSGSFSSNNPQLSEKEQLRLYQAARDAQQDTENRASSSSAGLQNGSFSSSSTAQQAQPLLTRPAPSYAANYSQNGIRSSSSSQGQESVPPVPPPFNQSSISQQALSSQPRRNASVTGARPLPSTSPPPSNTLGEGSSTLPPSFSSHINNNATSSSVGEKAQMKAYYEAKDAAEENARLQVHSAYASSADLYAAAPSFNTSSTSNLNSNGIAKGKESSSFILPPLQLSTFQSSPTPPSLGFNSVLSPIPASAISAASTTTPSSSSSTSNFNSIPGNISRFNPPPIPPNPYAPKRAKSSWEELDGDEEDGSAQTSQGVKPPLPPKTPVMR